MTINKSDQLLTTLDVSVSVAKNISNLTEKLKKCSILLKLRFICQIGNTAVESLYLSDEAKVWEINRQIRPDEPVRLPQLRQSTFNEGTPNDGDCLPSGR